MDGEHEGGRKAKICVLSLDRTGKVIRSKRLVERDYRNPVFVDAEKIDDSVALKTARDIAKKVEDEMTYPGEIKITLLREVRCVEYAR